MKNKFDPEAEQIVSNLDTKNRQRGRGLTKSYQAVILEIERALPVDG